MHKLVSLRNKDGFRHLNNSINSRESYWIQQICLYVFHRSSYFKLSIRFYSLMYWSSSSLALSLLDVSNHHNYSNFIDSTSRKLHGSNTKPFAAVRQPKKLFFYPALFCLLFCPIKYFVVDGRLISHESWHNRGLVAFSFLLETRSGWHFILLSIYFIIC